MLNFLSHDFNEARWRTAALKNAYALISKQRFGKSTFPCELHHTYSIPTRQSMLLLSFYLGVLSKMLSTSASSS